MVFAFLSGHKVLSAFSNSRHSLGFPMKEVLVRNLACRASPSFSGIICCNGFRNRLGFFLWKTSTLCREGGGVGNIVVCNGSSTHPGQGCQASYSCAPLRSPYGAQYLSASTKRHRIGIVVKRLCTGKGRLTYSFPFRNTASQRLGLKARGDKHTDTNTDTLDALQNI